MTDQKTVRDVIRARLQRKMDADLLKVAEGLSDVFVKWGVNVRWDAHYLSEYGLKRITAGTGQNFGNFCDAALSHHVDRALEQLVDRLMEEAEMGGEDLAEPVAESVNERPKAAREALLDPASIASGVRAVADDIEPGDRDWTDHARVLENCARALANLADDEEEPF